MPSKEFEQFYQTLKQSLPDGTLTIQEIRLAIRKMMSDFPMSPDLIVEPIELEHCSGAWIKPPKITSQKIILFIHGGAYIAGSWREHQDLIGRLATGAGLAVCAVDYRLAPEHPMPAATNDVLNAYKYLLASGFRHDQIILCGTSAGGGLALILLQKLKELKIKLPKAAILMSPWVDLALTGKTLKTNEGKDFITYDRIKIAAKTYLGKHDPKDPAVSPIYGNLSGLPPLLIQAGTCEILWSEIETLVHQAQASGTQVTFEPYEGMFHTWQLFASRIPEGQQAIASICHYINKI